MKYYELRVGDKVSGKNSRAGDYTGTVVYVSKIEVRVDWDESSGHIHTGWSCRIRENGDVATAYGMDDGDNLEFAYAHPKRRILDRAKR